MGKLCVEPSGQCFPDALNPSDDEMVELFSISHGDAAQLTVSGKATLRACAQVKDAQVDCDGLGSFLTNTAQEWAEKNINGPAREFLTSTCRRQLNAAPVKHSVIRDIAGAAVEQVSGGHRRLTAALHAAKRNGTSDSFSQRLVAHATAAALNMTQDRIVDAVAKRLVEEQEEASRRRLVAEPEPDFQLTPRASRFRQKRRPRSTRRGRLTSLRSWASRSTSHLGKSCLFLRSACS